MELKKLKELREDIQLSQYELAPQLDLTQGTYANYEIGKTEPRIKTLCKMADFYNISLDYLVGRKFLDEVGYLNSNQKQLVELIKELNELNTIKAIGYISGLVAGQ